MSSTPSASSATPAAGSSSGTSEPSKRHRNRKPTKDRGAAGPEGGSVLPQPAQNGPGPRAEGHWRGGGPPRGSFRGRGNGVGRGRGGARGFSSTAERPGQSNGEMEDLGLRLGGAGLRPALSPLSLAHLSVHRDFSTTSAPGFEAPRNQGPPVANPRRKKGKGKQATQDVSRQTSDHNAAMLERIALKNGEEGGFDLEVERLYETQRASPEALAARQYLIDQLTEFFNREHFRWGHSHNSFANPIQIEAFGSVRFGLSTSKSDLDLCLFDPYRPDGFSEKYFSSSSEVSKLPGIYDMREVGNKLRMAGLSKVQPIPFAGVPIVKFEARIGDEVIQADINTNERLGVLNSRLINAYCNLHPLIRPLCVLIKFWANQRDLNDPSGQAGPVTLSSYTLILLVIAYLQHINFVPNLQADDLIEEHQVERTRFFSTPKVRMRRGKMTALRGSTGWDVTFVEDLPEAPRGTTRLKDLARGFFDYYGSTFQCEKEVVSIQHGSPFPRQNSYITIFDELELAQRAAATAQPSDLSPEEVRRQAEEDDLLLELDVEEPVEVKAASRSSSPFLYEYFEEPDIWSRRPLVVQDPFDLLRNTAGNIEPDIVETLQAQMLRARDLIDADASISTICASIKLEQGYRSLAEIRKGWRKSKVKQMEQQQRASSAASAPTGLISNAARTDRWQGVFDREGRFDPNADEGYLEYPDEGDFGREEHYEDQEEPKDWAEEEYEVQEEELYGREAEHAEFESEGRYLDGPAGFETEVGKDEPVKS